MIELRFYFLALVVPKHNALSVSRRRDVLGRTKKAEEFLLDFHEGWTAQTHRRGDLTQIDRFAVLLPAAEHAVAAGLPRDAAVGAKADRGREFTVFAGAVNPHKGTIRELSGFFA